MNGTRTTQLYDWKEMSISEAAAMQSNYLGSETNKDGETLIDPYNSEIKKIAQQVKSETGSDDTWTIARALFIWLKNNTVYYIDPETSDYSSLPAETLHNGKGKCDELSHLYISMLRANGIPARFVQGYLVYGNTKRYISHRWVEFYDGEWVPVEVSGGNTNASTEANYNFAILGADHVKIFVDDGTSASMAGIGSYTSSYYDWPSAVSPFDEYYDAISYDPMYLAACADGTRELMEEME